MNDPETIIDKLAFGGSGVCRINGKVCFVPFSCPGDKISIIVTSEKSSYLIGKIDKLSVPSPFRVKPRCSVFGKCGGCSWQHIEYTQQLSAKYEILVETLWRGARVANELVRPVLPSPSQYCYRSRVQFKLSVSVDGLKIGFFRTNSHIVEDIGSAGCAIAMPVINTALAAIRKTLAKFSEVSAIPNISIDCNENGVIAVITYNGREKIEIVRFFLERRTDLLPLTGLYLSTSRNQLQKIYCNGHPTYTLPSFPFESKTTQLAYHPGGFSQVNRDQNSAMLLIVRQLACFQSTDHILDLYCGNGNFSLPIAGDVASVTGIEESKDSIATAEMNRTVNGITNVFFNCADAATAVKRFVDCERHFNTVILDPPRAGAAETVSELYRLNPFRIIYISCNPSTLARDCGLLANKGYFVRDCVPLDMFPQTYHLESVTLFQKQ